MIKLWYLFRPCTHTNNGGGFAHLMQDMFFPATVIQIVKYYLLMQQFPVVISWRSTEVT